MLPIHMVEEIRSVTDRHPTKSRDDGAEAFCPARQVRGKLIPLYFPI